MKLHFLMGISFFLFLVIESTIASAQGHGAATIDGLSLGLTEAQADEIILRIRPFKKQIASNKVAYYERPAIIEGAFGPVVEFDDAGKAHSIEGHQLTIMGQEIRCGEDLAKLDVIDCKSQEFDNAAFRFRLYGSLHLVVRYRPKTHPAINGLRLLRIKNPPQEVQDIAW